MIVTCGEAVLDLIPDRDAEGRPVYRPVLGGSLFNVALGVARLGGRSGYLWELGDDAHGDLFRAALADAGGSLDLTVRGRRPTPIAIVEWAAGEPSYRISDPGGVMRDFDPGELDDGALSRIACLHLGSVILAVEPVASRLEALARSVASAGAAPVSIDLNVRPAGVSDWPAYRARLSRMIAAATIVKASAEDLAHFAPGRPVDTVMDDWVRSGAKLVIVTLGARGVLARTAAWRLEQPAFMVDVVDTVGAGDAFQAALLSYLCDAGAMSHTGLATAPASMFGDALDFAQAAAAMVCGRRGAQMPWAQDVAEWLGSRAPRRRAG